MTRRPHLRRLATATATALGLAMILTACGIVADRQASTAARSRSSFDRPGTAGGGRPLRGHPADRRNRLEAAATAAGERRPRRHPVQDGVQPVPGREPATRGARRGRDRPGQCQRDPADLRGAVRRARFAEHHRRPGGQHPHPGGGGSRGQHHHRRGGAQGQEGRLRAEHHGALLPVEGAEGRPG